MKFERRDAPYWRPRTDVASQMLQVLVALVPAAVAHVWFFGPGLLFNLLVAGIFAIAGEATMMWARGRPPERALRDYSAIVTAALLAFALPSLTPWWVTATGALFAVVVAKHLYGGLGFNIFNPAMAGYVVVLVAFPMHLNLWVAPRMGDIDYHHLSIIQTLIFTLSGKLPAGLDFDAISRATPLDAMKTGLNNMATAAEIRALPIMGDFGGSAISWRSADSGCCCARSYAGRYPWALSSAFCCPHRSCTWSTPGPTRAQGFTCSPARRYSAPFSSRPTRCRPRPAPRGASYTASASAF